MTVAAAEEVGDTEETFSVSEAARFFDRSVAWLRWREGQGSLTTESGEPIQVRRTSPPRAVHGYRRYTLQNIEDIARALHRDGHMSDTLFRQVMARVNAFKVQG